MYHMNAAVISRVMKPARVCIGVISEVLELPEVTWRQLGLIKGGLKVSSVACNSVHFLCSDGPIITDEELTSLPLVRVIPNGQYSGPKLSSVVRMMRGLLEQKVPLQEFEVLFS